MGDLHKKWVPGKTFDEYHRDNIRHGGSNGNGNCLALFFAIIIAGSGLLISVFSLL